MNFRRKQLFHLDKINRTNYDTKLLLLLIILLLLLVIFL